MNITLLLLSLLVSASAWSTCIPQSEVPPSYCKRNTDEDSLCAQKKLSSGAVLIGYTCEEFAQGCPKVDPTEKVMKLTNYITEKRTFEGEVFPRDNRYLFRAILMESTQFNPPNIIMTALGDPLSFIGSYSFDNSKRSADTGVCKNQAEEYRPVLASIKENDNWNRSAKNGKIRGDIDYYAPEGYRNSSPEVIFMTPYLRIAGIYGKKIMIAKNSSGRGLDMHYYNFLKNKNWFGPWMDYGEFIFPSYVQNEVHGMMYMKGGADGREYGKRPIEKAYIKVPDDKGDVVALVEGGHQSCLILDGQNRIVECEDPFRKDIRSRNDNECQTAHDQNIVCRDPIAFGATAASPIPLSEPFPLVAVFKACPVDEDCSVSHTVIDRQKKSDKDFKDLVSVKDRFQIGRGRFFKDGKLHRIAAFDLNGVEIEAPITEDGKGPKGIKIISAQYGDMDITGKAQAFCSGKAECGYKVAHKFVFGERKSDFVGAFNVKWICLEDKAKTEHTGNVASPAEDKVLTLSCPF